MSDYPDVASGYYFYVPSRMLWTELSDKILEEGYTLTKIDDEDDYYIYEVSKD